MDCQLKRDVNPFAVASRVFQLAPTKVFLGGTEKFQKRKLSRGRVLATVIAFSCNIVHRSATINYNINYGRAKILRRT